LRSIRDAIRNAFSRNAGQRVLHFWRAPSSPRRGILPGGEIVVSAALIAS